ncbi:MULTISPECIES: nicotinamide mononucleotide transporter [unclassified Polaromonas]|jgi:hypothetical protein|uniref:nicotinamide mononucleotide transporter n=1 Tax=unclassified Polaromonas TaxID=2638319 RepID=UPI000BC8F813|nr:MULTISPECIES: nicotinamide mononucleotide transporter [unclassified Polaromonas]OYY33344.1 MAG: hypothetical protein B7Y60_19125 [Polaromonas sp. 35-63-35]OYZ18278.1 MAG: hypothetical protein B7Y28_16360 [Polaromonas sp. 16-63-31]OZA48091.1 MAG: hypothetical protein B7X88_19915 [Polaromonas sp. 17-63-33]
MYLPLKRWFIAPSLPAYTVQTKRSSKRAEWAGAAFGVTGAVLLCLNIEMSPYGWHFLLLSNICLIAEAVQTRALGRLVMQIVFMVTSTTGIVRWMT